MDGLALRATPAQRPQIRTVVRKVEQDLIRSGGFVAGLLALWLILKTDSAAIVIQKLVGNGKASTADRAALVVVDRATLLEAIHQSETEFERFLSQHEIRELELQREIRTTTYQRLDSILVELQRIRDHLHRISNTATEIAAVVGVEDRRKRRDPNG